MTDGTGLIKPPADSNYSHRFPAEIVSHAVWLYHVFNLSLRNAALLRAGCVFRWIVNAKSGRS